MLTKQPVPVKPDHLMPSANLVSLIPRPLTVVFTTRFPFHPVAMSAAVVHAAIWAWGRLKLKYLTSLPARFRMEASRTCRDRWLEAFF